eukprot:153943_1
MQNILILFALHQHKKLTLEQDNSIEPHSIIKLYSCKDHQIALIPIIINYFQLNPKFNNGFRNIKYSQCDHHQEQTKQCTIINFLQENCDKDELVLIDDEFLNERVETYMYYAKGCCKQCAILLTPQIVTPI